VISSVLRGGLFAVAILWTTGVYIFHMGTLRPPSLDMSNLSGSAVFIEKTEKSPLQHLILQGDPYSRGLKGGQATKHLLYRQEVELTSMLEKIFHNRFFIYLFEAAIIPIFKGVEVFIPKPFLLEMYGVSESTAPEFDIYAEPYTRQLAYHGLHEVGQMMVDQYKDDRMENMGCTAILHPLGKSWLVGRNFDFEGGPTLDEKKIVKWVFPETGISFVSVIWAGMVGGVTAVNEKGIYLSLNAAGSEAFNRHGLPSTLLLTKVMESAETSEAAIEILRSSTLMITEIFVLVDSRQGKAFRIEKSPLHTEVIELTEKSAVTNHLTGEFWRNDGINQFRKDHLTSVARQARAEKLLTDLKVTTADQMELDFLKILRDKKDLDGSPLHFGNRRSLDPLIANHSVIFNGASLTLYVSRGPHLTAAYDGYDLAASFQKREPVFVKSLPADKEINAEVYADFKKYLEHMKSARAALNEDREKDYFHFLEMAETLVEKNPRFADPSHLEIKAKKAMVANDTATAQKLLGEALALKPAYKKDSDRLTEALHAIR